MVRGLDGGVHVNKPGAVERFDHLSCQSVTFAGDGFEIDGYLAQPEGEQPRPGLLVLHDVFGVGEHYPDLARRFAQLGYVALVPNTYARTGAPDPSSRDDLFAKHFGVPDADVVTDLKAAATYLRGLPRVTKLGCIGFCGGGRQTLLLACGSDVLEAAVDCWGGQLDHATPMPRQQTTAERPVTIMEQVQALSCPLLVCAGLEDIHPTPDEVRAFETRLQALGKQATVKYYEGAGHAFLNDSRPQLYHERAAFQAWDDIRSFLAARLD